MRSTSALHWVFLLAGFLIIAHAQEASDFFTTPCTTNDECVAATLLNTVCANDGTGDMCACDADNNWKRDVTADICKTDFFTTTCATSTDCLNDGLLNTVCVADATTTMKCRCDLDNNFELDATDNTCRTDFFTTPCGVVDDCTTAGHLNTVCVDDGTGATMCRCDVENNFKLYATDNKCKTDFFTNTCVTDETCTTDHALPNTVCVADATGTDKCRCDLDNNFKLDATDNKCKEPSQDPDDNGLSEPDGPGLEVEASDFFTTPCNTTDNCIDDGPPMTVCDEDATSTKMCRCDVENYWKRDVDEDKCLLQQSLGGVCQSGLSICTDANAMCKDDGSNSGTNRCICKDLGTDFIAAKKDDGSYFCAKILTRTMDTECSECIDNEGVCYNKPDSDGNFGDVRGGCRCPVSRSGVNCEVVHVEVKCDLQEFTMNICYTPHAGLTGQTLEMYTDGFGTVPECKAKLLTADSADCPAGSYEVKLSMKENERLTCGTKSLSSGRHEKKYENKLVVQDSPDASNWKLFKSFCSFNTHADMSTGSMGVVGLNENDRGQHIDPDVSFYVENILGEMIPNGVAIKLNDKVRFLLDLNTENGTYAALKPTMCTASSSGAIPDPKAAYITLLVDGCPPENSEIMTEDNRFRRTHNKPDEVQTGLIKMFKTKKSSSVFIHCTIQLCLEGSEDDCRPSVCDGTTDNRKRRAAADSERDVNIQVDVYDPDDQASKTDQSVLLTTTGFALVISMVVGIVVVAMVVAAVFAYRAKTRANKVGDNVELSQNPPQRFALPRINRNHMRL